MIKYWMRNINITTSQKYILIVSSIFYSRIGRDIIRNWDFMVSIFCLRLTYVEKLYYMEKYKSLQLENKVCFKIYFYEFFLTIAFWTRSDAVMFDRIYPKPRLHSFYAPIGCSPSQFHVTSFSLSQNCTRMSAFAFIALRIYIFSIITCYMI